jgi:hypothetical protein
MSKFDALELAVDQPSRMTIHHPITGVALKDKKGDDAWIDLLSADSEKGKAFERKLTQSRLSQRVRQQISAEQLESEHASRLANLCAGWRLLTLDGSALDVAFNEANAVELFSNNKMTWLREQVEAFLATRANFTKSLSKS